MTEKKPIQFSKLLSPPSKERQGRGYADFISARSNRSRVQSQEKAGSLTSTASPSSKSPSRMLSSGSATLVSKLENSPIEGNGSRFTRKNGAHDQDNEQMRPIKEFAGIPSTMDSGSVLEDKDDLFNLKNQIAQLKQQLDQKAISLAKAEKENRELKNKNDKLCWIEGYFYSV